jgi:hypothetical protein
MTIFLAMTGAAHAGILYPDPIGGWLYEYDGDAATAGAADSFDSLDGTWDHSNGNDEWDGTGIGAGRPGGVSSLDSSGTSYLRIQDTGDPRDYGMGDPGSNRKLYFGHSITTDVGASGNNILDDGITISFRTRISTGAPLDDAHPDGGGGIVPWPAVGDGYTIHDGGKGNFGVEQSSGGTISFSLALSSDSNLLSSDALILNNLNGNAISPNVDTGEAGIGNPFFLSDATQWHEFWITIEEDASNTGTHKVDIYADGSFLPTTFFTTAGDGTYGAPASYLLMGTGSTDQSGAFDVDFFSYSSGVHAPVPEPTTMLLLGSGLIGLAAFSRRFRK